MRYYSFDEIRKALARKLSHRPKEEIWGRLVEEDYVREVLEETAEIDYLEEKYREFERIPGALLQPQKDTTGSGLPQIRLQILSDLTARQAAKEHSVITFRRQHLNEGLINLEQVEEWISKQAREDGPASRYLKVPIPDDRELVTRAGGILTEPPLIISDTTTATQVNVELLSYTLPEDQWIRRHPVKHGGTLDSLRMVSKLLARRYTWWAAQGYRIRFNWRKSFAMQLAWWGPYGV